MKKHRTAEFDLDAAVARWSRNLRRSAGLEDGTIAELEAHVRDEVEDLMEQGKNPEEAFRQATERIDTPEAIGAEYHKSDSRGLFPVLPGQGKGSSLVLFLNGIKVSLRKMRRQRWYSLINISGLAIGMACSILILLWVRNELSYDRFHAGTGRIFRLIQEAHEADGVSVHPWLPFPLGPALKENFPEIAAVTRWAPDDMVVRYKDHANTELGCLTVDPAFFEIFSFRFLRGEASRALAAPGSIVIRDTMARKYFGDEDPIGKVLHLSERADLVVTGVVSIPENSDFQHDFFFSFRSYPLFGVDLASYEADWQSLNYQCYILLREGCSAEGLERKMSGFLKTRLPDRERRLRLQALRRLHLFRPDGTDGAMRHVRIFSLIAAFVLLIACVNFMNLATARAEARAKEVGLRKMLGGTRGQLIRQFFSESFLHTVLALAAALVLVRSALPFFNQITGRRLTLDPTQAGLVGTIAAIALLAGLAAGLYPALFLSSLSPARTIRSAARPGGRRARLRTGLVIFQFTLSTILIIGTLVINAQLAFISKRDLGMAKDGLVYVQMQKKSRDSVEAIRQELLRHPGIAGVASSSQRPFNVTSSIGYLDWEGRPADKQVYFSFMSVDVDFVSTCGMTIVSGRDFSRSTPDDVNNFLINETARRQMGIEDPVGKLLDFHGLKGRIVGVVKDFASQHAAHATPPMVLTMSTRNAARRFLLVRLQPGAGARALARLQEVWARINPAFPCEYKYLDESFDRLYDNERRLSQLFFCFAALAVIISCLGLVGLSSYMAEEKTKEIGIRKSLGASSGSIVLLLSANFIKLVILADAIAWPIGYLIMRRWLQDYAFRTSIRIPIFVLAAALGLLTALLSVAWQTLRAAEADPVKSLRYE